MTKKPKTSRNQNLMQRIYSCNDYVCMHKKEPEGFRKRRKSPTVLVETGAKIAFYLDFDLINFYTIFCLFVVMMFLHFFENTINRLKLNIHDKFQIMITVGSSYIRKHSWWLAYSQLSTIWVWEHANHLKCFLMYIT